MARDAIPLTFTLFITHFASPAIAADPIGAVEVVRAWAYGTPPDSSRQDLQRSSPVYSGELIETVRTGEVRIEFVDGTTKAMGSDSAMVLDELVFDPADDTMKIELAAGFFHFVTGSVDKEAVVITTPAMVIGVRGTDLAISVAAEGTTEVSVRDGTATATPRAGGDMVDIDTGQTGTAGPDDNEVGVSDGVSGATAGDMPASGSGFGGRGTAGAQGNPEVGDSDVERDSPEPTAEPDPNNNPNSSP